MQGQLFNSIAATSTQTELNNYYIVQTSKIPKLAIPYNSNDQNNHQQYDQLSTWRGETRNRFMDTFIMSQPGQKAPFDMRSSKKLQFIEEQCKTSRLSPCSEQHSQIIGKYNSFWEYKNNVFQKYFWGNGVYAISDLTDLFSQLQQKLKTIFDQIYCAVTKQEDSILLQKIEKQIIQRETSAVNYFVERIQNILEQSELDSKQNFVNTGISSKVSYMNEGSTKGDSKDKYSLIHKNAQNYVDYLNQNILKHTQSIQQFSYGQILEHSKYSTKISRQQFQTLPTKQKKSGFTTQQKPVESQNKRNNYQIVGMLDTIYSLRKQNRQLKARLRSVIQDYNSSFSFSLMNSGKKEQQLNESKYDNLNNSPRKFNILLNSPHSTLLLSQQKQNNNTANIQYKMQSPKYCSKKLFEKIPKYIPIKTNQKDLKVIRQSPSQVSSFKPVHKNLFHIDSPINQLTNGDIEKSLSSKVSKNTCILKLQSKTFNILLISEKQNLSMDYSISQFNALQQLQTRVFQSIDVKAIKKRQKIFIQNTMSLTINLINKIKQQNQMFPREQISKNFKNFDQSSLIQADSFFDDQCIAPNSNRNFGYIVSINELKQFNRDFKRLFKLYIRSTWSLNKQLAYFQKSFSKLQSVIQQLFSQNLFKKSNEKNKIIEVINILKQFQMRRFQKRRKQIFKIKEQFQNLKVEYFNTQSALQALRIFNKWCIEKAQDQQQLFEQTLKKNEA